MNNDEQDMQPQASQVEENENAAGDNITGTDGNEAGDQTAGQAPPDADSMVAGDDQTTANDAGSVEAETVAEADDTGSVEADSTVEADDAGSVEATSAMEAETSSDSSDTPDADTAIDADAASDTYTDATSDIDAVDAASDSDAADSDAASDADATGDSDAASDIDVASDADVTEDADTTRYDDGMSEIGSTDVAEESSAMVIAAEARDNQDAQMPGEVELPTEGEAAPQVAQASETSQAEGEPDSWGEPAVEVEAAPYDAAADSVEISTDETAVPTGGTGVDESATETTDESAAIGTDETADVGTDETAVATGETGVDYSAAEDTQATDESASAAVSVEESAAATGETGVGESASMSTAEDAGVAVESEADGGYEEPVLRSTRLQDVAPNASMEDLLRASEQQYRTLKHGDVVEGTIMKVGRDEILIDIGAKTEGIIPSAELQSLTTEERDALQIGDSLLVSVVQPENNEGHAVLSLDRARQERSWRDLQKRFEGGEVIQARVTGYNKGGLLVNLEGVRGFVPSSQISSLTGGSEANKQSEMAKLQNQTIPMKIIEINRSRNRLILSERQAMQEQRESVRSRLLRELEPGQVRQGRVSSICDFGAFVDIGGADGLIHLSEISWKRVGHPNDVLKVGDIINVYVLSVDPNERKIALSLKRTQPEPWSTITENYKLGQIVRGTITQLTTFGAFARLEDGIEGLIHVSELAEGRVAHPKNVVNVGDMLDLKVIRIDPAKRRIGLSLKRVNEDAEAPMPTDEDGDETAPSAAPTMGATGEYDVAPVDQAEMAEAASMEAEQAVAEVGAEAQPQAQASERPDRPERAERAPREQSRPQSQRGQDRGQSRQQAPPAPDAGTAEEPMGALAQALGAFMNRDSEEEES